MALERQSQIRHLGEQTEQTLFCRIRCGVANAGVGPALDVLMMLRLTGLRLNGCEGMREMSFIGAGQADSEGDQGIIIPVRVPPRVTLPSVDELSGSVEREWEIDLEYTDVFGERFVTRHTSDGNARWATFSRAEEDVVGAALSAQ